MSDKEEDVFVDAKANTEDEITPRRSNRKRRSTAGSTPQPPTVSKKAKSANMPLLKSPAAADTPAAAGGARSKKAPATVQAGTVPASNQDDFWVRMNAMLGGTEARMTSMIEGTESRLKAETVVVREALENKLEGVVTTVDDLKNRVMSQEKRIDTMEENICNLVDERIASKMALARSGGADGGGDGEEEEEGIVERAWGSPKKPSYAGAVRAG